MTNKYKSEQREYRKKRYISRVKKIGAKLAKLRQRKKYSLQLLAQKSHVNVNTIYKIEKGEVDASLLTLMSLSEALDYQFDEFIISLYPNRTNTTGKIISLLERSDGVLLQIMLKVLENTYATWNYCKTCPECKHRDTYYSLNERLKKRP